MSFQFDLKAARSIRANEENGFEAWEKAVRASSASIPASNEANDRASTVSRMAAGIRSRFAKLLSGVKTGPKLQRTRQSWFGRKLRRAQAAWRARQRRRAMRAARLKASAARVAQRAATGLAAHMEPALEIRALEPRVVFDGAGAVSASEAADNYVPDAGDFADDLEQAATVERATSELVDAAASASVSTSGDARRDVVFVDGSVENYEGILSEVPASAEVIVLEKDSDGVLQIADVLRDQTDIDAIHIISHGDAGELALGNATLTETSMRAQHADAMAVLGAALTEAGDVLIYGCDFGADAQGASAVETFRELTGADIAASDDDTGHADLGGDWDLEVEAGAIEAQAIEATAWNGLLVPTNSQFWSINNAGVFGGKAADAQTNIAGVGVTLSLNGDVGSDSSVYSLFNDNFSGSVPLANGATGGQSLSLDFDWDTTPEGQNPTRFNEPTYSETYNSTVLSSTTDGGSATLTLSFTQAVTNPIIHLDRLGGFAEASFSQSNGPFAPPTVTFQEAQKNSTVLTLVGPGTLTRLAGTTDFQVSGNAIQATTGQATYSETYNSTVLSSTTDGGSATLTLS
ncbi:MAG: DUF4347 domain-containing protein, partial [Pseudomonadota bacterium]